MGNIYLNLDIKNRPVASGDTGREKSFKARLGSFRDPKVNSRVNKRGNKVFMANFAGLLAWWSPEATQQAENLDSEIALAISTIGT